MLEFITNNLGNIIVLGIILLVSIIIIVKSYKDKKQGNCCNGNCLKCKGCKK